MNAQSNRLVSVLAIVAGLVMLFSLVEHYWPIGPDYYYHYRPLADEWVSGSWRLYGDDQVYLVYPPWSALFIAPLGLMSLDAGKAALFLLTTICIVASLRLIYGRWRVPRWVLFVSLANLYTLDALLRGQLDTVALFGMVSAWWAARNNHPWILSIALCVATVKPPANIVLPLLAILFELRHWSIGNIARVATFPLLCIAGSFVVFGLTWPVEFLQNLQGPINYLSISLWRAGNLLGIPSTWIGAMCTVLVLLVLYEILHSPLNLRALSIAIAANLLVTPYANGDYYVLLIPAFAYVAARNWKWSVLAYAFSFTPLLRTVFGYDAAVADLFFPVILLACSWFLPDRTAQDHASPSKGTARSAMV
ncbi:MAG: glycosyltransferase family 87 protein [Anaerolineae bacterium]